jgi:hypothetical protein
MIGVTLVCRRGCSYCAIADISGCWIRRRLDDPSHRHYFPSNLRRPRVSHVN